MRAAPLSSLHPAAPRAALTASAGCRQQMVTPSRAGRAQPAATWRVSSVARLFGLTVGTGSEEGTTWARGRSAARRRCAGDGRHEARNLALLERRRPAGVAVRPGPRRRGDARHQPRPARRPPLRGGQRRPTARGWRSRTTSAPPGASPAPRSTARPRSGRCSRATPAGRPSCGPARARRASTARSTAAGAGGR